MRSERFRLTAAARELHAAVGHKCSDCGATAVYEPAPNEGEAILDENGEVTGRTVVGSYICPKCGQVVSKTLAVRSSLCGLKPLPGRTVSVAAMRHDFATGEARAGVTGVRRCNKPWVCPSCASARRIDDARTITAAVQGFRDELAGRRVYLVTLTVPHTADQRLKGLRMAVTKAYWKALSGKRFKLMRARHSIRASLRRLEVTHSAVNGWHPHIHALWFTERQWSPEELKVFADTLRGYFGVALEKLGFDAPAEWCVDVQEAIDPGDYLAKMGVLEVAGDADVKEARCRNCRCVQPTRWCAETDTRLCAKCDGAVNRSPWQILADYAAHRSAKDRGILRKYFHEIRGARMLTWSRFDDFKLREQYPAEEEPPQLELAPEEKPPLELTREAWRAIGTDPHRVSALLDAYEVHDRIALELVLGEHMPPAKYPVWEEGDPEPRPRWERWFATDEERLELQLAGERIPPKPPLACV